MTKLMSLALALGLALGLLACGGSNGSPTTPSTQPPQTLPAATTISVNAGVPNPPLHQDAPFVGAVVSVSGQRAGVTDASGNITLSIGMNNALTIDGRQASPACQLPRETIFTGGTTFALWCQDPGFIQPLVYGGNGQLMGWKSNTVNVGTQGGFKESMATQALADLTDANGRIVFALTDDASAPAVLACDPGNAVFQQHPDWDGFTTVYRDSGWITKTYTGFKRCDVLNISLARHELFLVFGGNDVPEAYSGQSIATHVVPLGMNYTDMDRRAMAMMNMRLSGSRPSIGQVFPDNDTKVGASAESGSLMKSLGRLFRNEESGRWLPPQQ